MWTLCTRARLRVVSRVGCEGASGWMVQRLIMCYVLCHVWLVWTTNKFQNQLAAFPS